METFEDLLQFESRKHIEFFLPYYQKKGWKVLKDNLGKNTDWDVSLEIEGKRYLIDEKANQNEWNNFLVEIIQDLKSGSPSWLYKNKDKYLYASWKDINEINPSSLYEVDSEKIKDFIATNFKELVTNGKWNVSPKGFGMTFFIYIEWQDLIYLNIAKKLEI